MIEYQHETFNKKPIEDSNWYFVVRLLIGEKRAKKWVKSEDIPLGRNDDS